MGWKHQYIKSSGTFSASGQSTTTEIESPKSPVDNENRQIVFPSWYYYTTLAILIPPCLPNPVIPPLPRPYLTHFVDECRRVRVRVDAQDSNGTLKIKPWREKMMCYYSSIEQ